MAEVHHYSAKLSWTGAERGPTRSYESYSRDYVIEIPGKPALEGSADKAFRGDPARANPEDLLVASLSACHMLSYLALAARAKLEVLSYEDDARGTMRLHERRMRFAEVVLRPHVVVAAGSDAALAQRLHHQAHEQCFVANSVNFPVNCEAQVRVAGDA